MALLEYFKHEDAQYAGCKLSDPQGAFAKEVPPSAVWRVREFDFKNSNSRKFRPTKFKRHTVVDANSNMSLTWPFGYHVTSHIRGKFTERELLTEHG